MVHLINRNTRLLKKHCTPKEYADRREGAAQDPKHTTSPSGVDLWAVSEPGALFIIVLCVNHSDVSFNALNGNESFA